MGDPHRGHELPMISDKAVERRLLAGLIKTSDGCWIWQKCLNKKGYGKMWYNGRNHLAHRISFAIFNGPIPEGLTLDHNCLNRACCNPDHLELISTSENSKRRWQECMF